MEIAMKLGLNESIDQDKILFGGTSVVQPQSTVVPQASLCCSQKKKLALPGQPTNRLPDRAFTERHPLVFVTKAAANYLGSNSFCFRSPTSIESSTRLWDSLHLATLAAYPLYPNNHLPNSITLWLPDPCSFQVPLHCRKYQQLEIENLKSSSRSTVEPMDVDTDPDNASSSFSDRTIPPLIDCDLWSGIDDFQDLDEPLTLEQMMRNLDDMVSLNEAATGLSQASCAGNDMLIEQDQDNLPTFKLRIMLKML
ncbi:hypothetical protein B0H17DRAFT_1275491 [Mycena rosella]|uniref:Uncharacterized protein n=1 Tax=Mycena rosella TaxID=1033263 RepID=A0AAD7GJZ5_MYCRO|nr:hypothetical protein B0H17DRAFT_1275491 [Mycena rosella]